MLKSFSNFQKEWCTFGRKHRTFEKNKESPFWKFECFEHAIFFWLVSKFENVIFTINGKYYNNIYDNPNYYASLVIFQTYKNVVLRNVH